MKSNGELRKIEKARKRCKLLRRFLAENQRNTDLRLQNEVT